MKISFLYHFSIKSYELFNFTKFCMEIIGNLRSQIGGLLVSQEW